jgi:flagellar basal body P-ring formation protein FlgA
MTPMRTSMKLPILLIAAVLLVSGTAAFAQSDEDTAATPALRANVTVTGDVVRIGDVIDNAGTAAQIAIYRAPDLGTTGTLSTAQVIATLRNYQVFGVDTKGVNEVSVTRLSRTLASRDIEQRVAHALEHRNGLGDAENLSITFDRELRELQLDASNTGELRTASTYFDSRSGRFDVLFEITNTNTVAPTRMRFTGTAVQTIEAAVLVRDVDHNEVIKASDVIVERRSKAEVGNEVASRDRAVGMQARKALHSGQALRVTDLAKPDWVQRDQTVTLIYQTGGLFLTMRAKAVDSGSEGDTVSVVNTQSKRTVQGVVSGPGQVTVSIAMPHPITTAAASPDTKTTESEKAE